MKFADVNVLLYAVYGAAPQQAAASRALRTAFVDGEMAFTWVALLGLMR